MQASFNGAAPVKERKTFGYARPRRQRNSLQWGRSGEGAEDDGAMGRQDELGRLQWGRSGEGAEDARPHASARKPGSGFNGAAPVKERKTSQARHRRPPLGRSFNGAAPVKERKTPKSRRDDVPDDRLQWGRSGEGAEDPATAVDDRRRMSASMGPLR